MIMRSCRTELGTAVGAEVLFDGSHRTGDGAAAQHKCRCSRLGIIIAFCWNAAQPSIRVMVEEVNQLARHLNTWHAGFLHKVVRRDMSTWPVNISMARL